MIKSVRNVTSRTLKFTAQTTTNPIQTFEIMLISNGVYELEPRWSYPTMIPDILEGKLSIVEGTLPEVADSTPAEPTTQEPISTEVEPDTTKVDETTPETIVDEVAKETTPEPTKFICDVCGEEFASARSLNSHKSKAHK